MKCSQHLMHRLMPFIAGPMLLMAGLSLCCGAAFAAIGDTAKLDGPLMNGAKYSLDAERGKVVLVVLWATWCPICRRELPRLETYYRENAAKGLQIVAVSIDDTPGVVSEYLAKNHYSFPVGWRNRFQDNLGRVRATPTIFLIDRQGAIRARYEGALGDGEWWEIDEELLKKPQPRADNEPGWLPAMKYRAL